MNPNDKTAHIYDIVNSTLKGEEVTNAEIELIKSLVRRDGKILDIGAGTGRHTIKLTELGYNVTAIDSSKAMLKVLDDQAKRKNLNIEMIRADVTKHDIGKSKYDLVISMWNSFDEIVHEEKSALTLLHKMKSALKPGGKILINVDDPDKFDLAKLNFHTEIVKEGLTYNQDWHVVDFDAPAKTTTSEETITVADKSGKVKEKYVSEIVQTWWCLESMPKLAKKTGLKLKVEKIGLNEELYFVLK